MTAKPRRPVHPFVPDPDLPHPDLNGRRVCASCHLLGRSDDARHTLPDAPRDVWQRAAGEKED